MYLFDKKICTIPILEYPLIFGDITIKTEINSIPKVNIYYVDFKLNNESIYRDDSYPFEYKIDIKLYGKQILDITAFSYNGENNNKKFEFIIFNNGLDIW